MLAGFRSSVLSVLAAQTLAMLVGCSGVPDGVEGEDSFTRDHEIIGGGLDQRNEAVMVMRLDEAGKPTSFCTGSVVSHLVVMTSASCIDNPDPGRFLVYSGIAYYLSDPIPEDVIEVEEVVMHPDYDGFDRHNIGLLHLAEPTNMPIQRINRTAITSTMFDRPVTLVGYGETDHQLNTDTAGARHAVDVRLRGFTADTAKQLIHLGTTDKQSCHDNGGPAYMKVGGARVIIGISHDGYNKEGTNKECVYGANYTRVDVEQAFLDDTVKKWGAAL